MGRRSQAGWGVDWRLGVLVLWERMSSELGQELSGWRGTENTERFVKFHQ